MFLRRRSTDNIFEIPPTELPTYNLDSQVKAKLERYTSENDLKIVYIRMEEQNNYGDVFIAENACISTKAGKQHAQASFSPDKQRLICLSDDNNVIEAIMRALSPANSFRR